MNMQKEGQQIKDPETEARELENALHDMSKSLRESSTRRGKSGLSYAEFMAHFLKKAAQTNTPSSVYH